MIDRFLLVACLMLSAQISYAQQPTDNTPISIAVFDAGPMNVVAPGDLAGANFTRPDGADSPLPSPSFLFATALRNELLSRHQLVLSEVPNTLLPHKRGKPIGPSAANSLEVYTDLNFLGYRAFAWNTYQYGFMGHARLIGPDGSVTWEKKCAIKPGKSDETLQLNRSEFNNQGGQRLIEVMQLATERCAKLLVNS